MKLLTYPVVMTLLISKLLFAHTVAEWQLGPFIREDQDNPIITPDESSTFLCPVQNKVVHWECDHTFNPAAVFHDGKIYVLYRAEDDFGKGIGCHTSRIGLAESFDGIHFNRFPQPVLYPDNDSELAVEWSGGCEDPRIVLREDGTYVMTYTQWTTFDHAICNVPLLAIATSKDLYSWKKEGYAFANSNLGLFHSKSGSIVCKQVGNNLVATKINDKYWMYWGEGPIYAAVSDDLLEWEPVFDKELNLLPVLDKRINKFDSALVEAGPPVIFKEDGILLIYNGKNAKVNGDSSINAGAYSAGQVLFNASNPLQVIARSEESFFKPERKFEKTGQYKNGTVFVEGLVPFEGKWLLYYGTADSAVAVAVADDIHFENTLKSTASIKAGEYNAFYYHPLPPSIVSKMMGKSYKKNCPIPITDLAYVKVNHYDMNGKICIGELVVNVKIADKVLEIFKDIFVAKFPIEKMRLIDEYDADDDRSMEDNNSSAFCYRSITNKPGVISNHGLGLAIDINTRLNPYVNGKFIAPINGKKYIDRSLNEAGMIHPDSAVVAAFKKRGFTWGGDWQSIKGYVDFQHFEFDRTKLGIDIP